MKNDSSNGHENMAYLPDEFQRKASIPESQNEDDVNDANVKGTWNNSIEFLMSCVALSIGFGNIWRFPFTAYENGGGAFLIPYVILLLLVGKPFYFLEMILGQFSGNSCIKVWSVCPAFVGVGWAQLCANFALMTYYSSLLALTLFFLIASFSAELPWAKCREEWGEFCVDSSIKKNYNLKNGTISNATDMLSLLTSGEQHRSSAELYFSKVVLQEKDNIDDGVGLPDWKLTLCLCGSWLSISLITFQGVKSSGKASYFLAIFPYIVLIMLLCRAVTLDGAVDGILFFITPKWSKLLEPSVWYAAVTQCFFSLSVCFGTIITYSAYNNFKHNIYRDALIITTLDTCTSTIAGCTIFGILGNLAYEMGINDIGQVVKSGAGLAFVSYPDAIAKFNFVPQLFSVLFFVMMFVLGVGSNVGMVSGIVTAISEKIPGLKTWQIVVPLCLIGFTISTIYVTPGGQFLLTLVDYYGTSFVVFILASFEITAVMWVYGIENFVNDAEFMLDRKLSVYWRICWFVLTPLILIIIFLYTVTTLTPLTYGGKGYPLTAQVCGWIIFSFAILQVPFWMLWEILKNRELPFAKMVKKAFKPASVWGPRKLTHKKNWLLQIGEKSLENCSSTQPRWKHLLCVIFNTKPK